MASAATSQQLCFHCEEKARLDDDIMCLSCKEEYRKCYECGQRERNHPFKLCTVCYKATQNPSAASAPLPLLIPPTVKTPSKTTGRSNHYLVKNKQYVSFECP